MIVSKKYRKVLKELIKLRFQKILMFHIGFWGPFLCDGSLFAIQLLAFSAIYGNVDTIGSWGKGEMILYIGTFSLLNAVNMMIYFFGINSIPGKIVSGGLDLYLTKPISPLFRLTFEQMNPGSGLLIVFSALIIWYGLRISEITLSISTLVSYIFWVILMELLYYEMAVLVRSITFYVLSNNRMTQLEDALLSMCFQVPGIAFYGIYKFLFYVILPYGIMATFPVQSMIGEMTWKMAIQGILTVAGFSVLTVIVWKKGLRRYNSASS